MKVVLVLTLFLIALIVSLVVLTVLTDYYTRYHSLKGSVYECIYSIVDRVKGSILSIKTLPDINGFTHLYIIGPGNAVIEINTSFTNDLSAIVIEGASTLKQYSISGNTKLNVYVVDKEGSIIAYGNTAIGPNITPQLTIPLEWRIEPNINNVGKVIVVIEKGLQLSIGYIDIAYADLKAVPSNAEATIYLEVSIINPGTKEARVNDIFVDNIRPQGFEPYTIPPLQLSAKTYTLLKINTSGTGKWAPGTKHNLTIVYSIPGYVTNSTYSIGIVVK